MILLLRWLFLLGVTMDGVRAGDLCSQPVPPSDSCTKPSWSQHGVTVAGNGTGGSSDGQLEYPMGIFVDHEDDLFVADSTNCRIQLFFNGGDNRGYTVAGGQLGPYRELDIPERIFVDALNDMFIMHKVFGELLKWPLGKAHGTTIAQGGIVNLGQYTMSLHGVSEDRQGEIYLSQFITFPDGERTIAKVVKYSKNSFTWPPTVVGVYNSSSGPKSVKVDQCDNVYVVDTLSNQILRFNNGTSTPEVVLSAPKFFPTEVTLDRYGNVYILEGLDNRVQRLNVRTGIMEVIAGSQLGEAGNDTEHLQEPASLALDSNNNLYVSDTWNHRVQRFDFLGGDLFC